MSESRDKTPLEALSDYDDIADSRDEAVRTLAAKHVEEAQAELITAECADVEQAKRDLRVALQILEQEI